MSQEENASIRLKTIKDILDDYRSKLNTIFDYDLYKLDFMVQEYYRELPKWKKYFQVKIIDRHKISALSIHYFLKHNPIILLNKESVYSLIITEVIALTIGLSRLKNHGKPIKPENLTYLTLLKNLKKHRENMVFNYENYRLSISVFITNLSTILYQIESKHISVNDLPQ
ncbi:MAG TPA: hypothetical protein DHW82_12905 [Spirochaetia bacterium]|nr:MAG: hypothetical protein A2Y41_12755 [Spirochaetes bacterium GWB1_36_13]HCL57889.1 hypothetical protein [Spirochaetia bacterium]